MISNCQKFLPKVKPQDTNIPDIILTLAVTTLILLYPLVTICSATTTSPGALNFPSEPVNTVIKTVCASGCNYSTIQAAINASSPGWTIQVMNGIYNESPIIYYKNCTQSNPCDLMAFPGDDPVIDGTELNNNGIFLRGSWWIIEGLEVKNAKYDGIKVVGPNNTIRSNYFHDNGTYAGNGIKINAGANDVLVENNISEFNGTNPGGCLNGGVSSPRHCHGIYLMNNVSPCIGLKNVTVRGNILRNQGGAGIQINSSSCNAPNDVSNFLLENNLILNTANGFNLVANGNDGVIRNNTVILDKRLPTNETLFAFIHMWGTGTGNIINNNIFYTTRSDVKGLTTFSADDVNNDFDYNLFRVVGNNWVWLGKPRSDFQTNYSSVTGWDTNGKCCAYDPEFISESESNYGITVSSPARNSGTNDECPAGDIDGFIRPEEGVCDIGMFEFVP